MAASPARALRGGVQLQASAARADAPPRTQPSNASAHRGKPARSGAVGRERRVERRLVARSVAPKRGDVDLHLAGSSATGVRAAGRTASPSAPTPASACRVSRALLVGDVGPETPASVARATSSPACGRGASSAAPCRSQAAAWPSGAPTVCEGPLGGARGPRASGNGAAEPCAFRARVHAHHGCFHGAVLRSFVGGDEMYSRGVPVVRQSHASATCSGGGQLTHEYAGTLRASSHARPGVRGAARRRDRPGAAAGAPALRRGRRRRTPPAPARASAATSPPAARGSTATLTAPLTCGGRGASRSNSRATRSRAHLGRFYLGRQGVAPSRPPRAGADARGRTARR